MLRSFMPTWRALWLAIAALLALAPAYAAPRVKANAKAARKGTKSKAVVRRAPPKLKGPKSSRSLTMAEKVKFSRVGRFAKRVDGLRAEVKKTLAAPKPDIATARASIVRLMDRGYLRVGSEQYASRGEKPSFGASSLRKQHVSVRGNKVTVKFIGKSGVKWNKTITDGQLASAIKVFLALPGERLFQYPSKSGKLIAVTEAQMRPFLKQYGALPKDFRTLHANRIFKAELSKLGKPKNPAEAERNIKKARGIAAKALNHEPETSEAAYVHPKHAEAHRAQAKAGSRGPP